MESENILCTDFSNGKKHDFKLYKESNVHIDPKTKAVVDTGYTGMSKLHQNTEIPKKRSKKNPLTKEDKVENRKTSSKRVLVENVIARVKRFKILTTPYRNRRKRFGLRFNLIAAITNKDLRL